MDESYSYSMISYDSSSCSEMYSPIRTASDTVENVGWSNVLPSTENRIAND